MMFGFRLGLLAGSPTGHNQIAPSSLSPTKPMKEKNTRSEDRQQSGPTSIKRFDSSLGSDTGTSTRESECSEEHTSVSPMSPISATKATLYDSLAAELRAKLNGNGPPLLLPPRDYDTVHRAKGNLAATELRRCRNSLIVGGPGSKYGVSSRGSSGIGSDLAPSPERQEAQSSSGEKIILFSTAIILFDKLKSDLCVENNFNHNLQKSFLLNEWNIFIHRYVHVFFICLQNCFGFCFCFRLI